MGAGPGGFDALDVRSQERAGGRSEPATGSGLLGEPGHLDRERLAHAGDLEPVVLVGGRLQLGAGVAAAERRLAIDLEAGFEGELADVALEDEGGPEQPRLVVAAAVRGGDV